MQERIRLRLQDTAELFNPILSLRLVQTLEASDPIAYFDGISLYGVYFVPIGVDPTGLQGCVCECKKDQPEITMVVNRNMQGIIDEVKGEEN